MARKSINEALKYFDAQMHPALLTDAIKFGVAIPRPYSLKITPRPSWTIPTEIQIASPTQHRLYEWAREWIFQKLMINDTFDTRTVAETFRYYHEVNRRRSFVVRPHSILFGKTSITIDMSIYQGHKESSHMQTIQVVVAPDAKGKTKPISIPESVRQVRWKNIIMSRTEL